MRKQISYFERKRVLKSANFLDLTPIHNFDYEKDNEGIITILIPRFTGFFGKRFLQPLLKYPFIKLTLDELGSATWLLIDTKNTVREICNQLADRFGERIHPVTDRVTRYISQLYMKQIIVFKETLKHK